jgi:hypothetical protein
MVLQLAAGATEVHRQPNQPLLRTVVDVALQSAERLGLGRPGGVATGHDVLDLLLELGSAAQQQGRQGAVADRREAYRQRQRQQGDRAQHQVEHDLRAAALAEADELGQRGVVRRVVGDEDLPEPVGEPTGCDRHQTIVTARAIVPVTSPSRHQRTSSHDCGSRSGVSERRQKPEPSRAQTYAGVAAGRPSIVRSRARSRRAKPRATMTARVSSSTPPTRIARPRPSDRFITVSTNAGTASTNADRL